MAATDGKETKGRTPFLAFVSDAASVELLRQFGSQHGWPASVVHEGDIKAATVFLRNNSSPQVLMVEIGDAKEAPGQLDALADVCEPGVTVIAVGSVNEYSFYCWLTDIGISSYLLKPFTFEAIEHAYKKTQAPKAAVDVKETGKIIAVLGARGGVGASTLAVNVASVIAAETKKSAALVDLDMQFGTAAMMLDIEPSRGLREAMEKPDRIDGLFLDRVAVKYEHDLSVIAAEESLDEIVQYGDVAVDTLTRQLRAKYSYIVADIPRGFAPPVRKLLHQVDTVVLVVEYNLLCLRDALRLQDAFKEKLKIQPPLIVANRVGAGGKHEMKRADFEKGLGAKIAFEVPFTTEVQASAAAGEVLALTKKNVPSAQAFHHVAAHLAPAVKGGHAPKTGGKQEGMLKWLHTKKA